MRTLRTAGLALLLLAAPAAADDARTCHIVWRYHTPITGPLDGVMEFQLVLRGVRVVLESRVVAEVLVDGAVTTMTTEWATRADARLTRDVESYADLELPDGATWKSFLNTFEPCPAEEGK